MFPTLASGQNGFDLTFELGERAERKVKKAKPILNTTYVGKMWWPVTQCLKAALAGTRDKSDNR